VIGQVDNVDIDLKKGAVLVNKGDDYGSGSAFTLGPYINSSNIEKGSDLYNHEAGHVMQSRIMGPLYGPVIAIPSGITYLFFNNSHDNMWYEKWASKLGGGNKLA